MMLADTSVWIDHLRNGNRQLADLLVSGQIVCHPFIIGELACGHLKRRSEILELLKRLRSLPQVENDQVVLMIEERAIMGLGLGWVDAHLLASALVEEVPLWTLDRRLADIARKQGVFARF